MYINAEDGERWTSRTIIVFENRETVWNASNGTRAVCEACRAPRTKERARWRSGRAENDGRRQFRRWGEGGGWTRRDLETAVRALIKSQRGRRAVHQCLTDRAATVIDPFGLLVLFRPRWPTKDDRVTHYYWWRWASVWRWWRQPRTRRRQARPTSSSRSKSSWPQ